MEFRKFCSWFDLTKYSLSEFERFWYNCVCCASCFYFKMCYNQDEKQKPSLLTWLKCKMWTDKRLLLRSQATVVFQMRLRGDCGHWMQMLIMVMELILDIRTTILILESSKVSRVPRILYFYILRFIKKKKKNLFDRWNLNFYNWKRGESWKLPITDNRDIWNHHWKSLKRLILRLKLSSVKSR